MRAWIASSFLSLLPAGVWAQSQAATYVWGGETRQVFHRDVGGQRLVWTVGDGPLIRHAVNPQGDDWTFQSPPSDVTQTLLDVYFLPDGLTGWACGVGGHVLKTTNGGTTWTHQDSGQVMNSLTPATDATAWRVRFNAGNQTDPGTVGFLCGLWTFKEWDVLNQQWIDTALLENGQPVSACQYEFYAMEMIVGPGGWVAVAAGQDWPACGGGAHFGEAGHVFYRTSGMSAWTEVFTTTLTDGTEIWDPWDIDFEENPASLTSAVGYLSAGGGIPNGIPLPTGLGAVYRTEDSGQTWDIELDGHQVALNTMYGVAAIGSGEAVAVGYGGQVWRRNPSTGTWTQKAGTAPGFTGPLGGARGTADGEVYATGSFGFIQRSDDGWTTAQNLNTPAAEDQSEQWRFEDVYFVSATTGYAVGAGKAIAVTTNGGSDFDLDAFGSETGPTNSVLHAIDFNAGATRGVAVGASAGSVPPPNLCAPSLARAFALYKNGSGAWQPACIPTSLASVPVVLRGVSWARLSSGSEQVWAVGYADYPNAPVPLVLRSTDDGVHWDDLDPSAVADGVKLMAVDFEGSVGFAVGYDAATETARAYRLDAASVPPAVVEIPVTGPSLRAVATNGTNTYAVGDEEGVYSYSSTSQSFLPETPAPPPLGPEPLDLLSVAIAPRTNYVLIGSRNAFSENESPGYGKLLRRDPTSGWDTLPAKTNKSVCSIHIRSTTSIWLLGRAAVEDISPEFGKVNDSVILRVNPVP